MGWAWHRAAQHLWEVPTAAPLPACNLHFVLPQKSPVYFLLVGGWSFSLYLLQLIFKNLREICKSYWQYLLGRRELWDYQFTS